MKFSEQSTIVALLVLPFGGLLYSGVVMGAMVSFPILRNHPLCSGGVVALTPLAIAASLWWLASAKAYARSRHHLKK